MSATFRQPEISVREELNALSNVPAELSQKQDKYDSDAVGVDIGGGETLWGDGSITGSNNSGSYTKWPNGDLECSVHKILQQLVTSEAVGVLYQTVEVIAEAPMPIESIDTPIFETTGGRISGSGLDEIHFITATRLTSGFSTTSFPQARVGFSRSITSGSKGYYIGFYARGKWK